MIFEERPWGNFTVLHTEATCQVKKLVVHSGKRLSLQSHKFRAEHWFIVSGVATVVLDGNTFTRKAGDTVDIEVGQPHRIGNAGTEELVFIEVQTGTYFGEDDIERLEDDFGR